MKRIHSDLIGIGFVILGLVSLLLYTAYGYLTWNLYGDYMFYVEAVMIVGMVMAGLYFVAKGYYKGRPK